MHSKNCHVPAGREWFPRYLILILRIRNPPVGMKFILIPFSLLLFFPLLAQNDPTEREVTVEDLQMKTFPSDTSAVAVL